jgi:hypothetical protein
VPRLGSPTFLRIPDRLMRRARGAGDPWDPGRMGTREGADVEEHRATLGAFPYELAISLTDPIEKSTSVTVA